MFKWDFIVFYLLFLSGILMFCFLHKHLLITLLSLEYLVLCVYMFFVLFTLGYLGEMYLIILFLVFSVCEGVLGLSILVSMIRCHGNDQVGTLFALKW